MRVKEPFKELEDLQDKSSALFKDEMSELVESIAYGNNQRRSQSVNSLAELAWQTMALSDLLGRRRVLLEVRNRYIKGTANFGITPIFPNVEFREAIQDIITREPMLARVSKEVSSLYRTRHGFAVAKSADLRITERIQTFISAALHQGLDTPTASVIISGIGDFSLSYASTVYRTNVASAYTAGRFQQAFDPDLDDYALAFEYQAIDDADVRPNHFAADGLIANKRDRIWDTYSTPMGYNCRCGLRIVDRYELRSLGLIGRDGKVETRKPTGFSAAHPDPGFGSGRADRRIYL